MNKAQRRILTAWVILATLVLLFPPYALDVGQGARRYHDFGFLLTGSFGQASSTVNVGLLAVMELVIAGIAGVLFLVTKDRGPE